MPPPAVTPGFSTPQQGQPALLQSPPGLAHGNSEYITPSSQPHFDFPSDSDDDLDSDLESDSDDDKATRKYKRKLREKQRERRLKKLHKRARTHITGVPPPVNTTTAMVPATAQISSISALTIASPTPSPNNAYQSPTPSPSNAYHSPTPPPRHTLSSPHTLSGAHTPPRAAGLPAEPYSSESPAMGLWPVLGAKRSEGVGLG